MKKSFFFTALAVAYVKTEDKNASLMLDDKFVYNFLSENNNLEKYKKGLLNLSGTAQNEYLKIDLDWDEILIQVSTVLDATLRRRGALVCENNRSYEISIDTAMWVATAAAAIASFGSGGVAVAGGRAALGAGLKALAKGAAKVGLKSAAKSISKQGGKQLAKAAVKVQLKTSIKGYAKYKGKGLAQRIATKAGERFIKKKGWMLATGAVAGAIYETVGTSAIANNSTPVKKNGQNAAGTLYSLVNSEPSTEIIGCQDLDYGEGCYAVCGHDQPDDDLNTKVFKPLLGQNYCVSEQDYTLYNMDTNRPLMLTDAQYKQVTEKIRQDVADKGENKDKLGTMGNQKNARHGCDWNEDDIDMYFGSYIYNPETLEPSTSMIIEEFIRIDD